MAKEIKDVFYKWLEKAKSGKKGYEIIYFNNNEWRYQSKEYFSPINSIDIVIWNDEGIRLLYRWNKEKGMDSGKIMAFVIKEEKQLMLYDEEIGCFVWGVSEKINSTDNAMILFEGDEVETIIAIAKDVDEVAVLSHVPNVEPDALTINWNFLMNRVSDEKESESEVNEDAGTSEPTVDESNAGWM